MINGYSDKLVELDDAMLALGRPPPPVVSWISGGLKGDINARHKAWLEQVAAWERNNPQASVEWLELRERYRVEDECEQQKKFSEDEWNYQLLSRIGAPERSVACIRSRFDDRACMKAAAEWLRSGGWCLVLIGGPGSGKSTAATWAAHQLLMCRTRPRWVDCPTQVDAPLFGPAAELEKHRSREAGVLVLEDLGSSARERDAKRPPAPWLDWLDSVLGHRHAQSRRTIITSNRGSKWLADWLGGRLADRISEGTVFSTSEPSMRGRKREPGDDDDDPRRRELYP